MESRSERESGKDKTDRVPYANEKELQKKETRIEGLIKFGLKNESVCTHFAYDVADAKGHAASEIAPTAQTKTT